jgi:hypothetical protein
MRCQRPVPIRSRRIHLSKGPAQGTNITTGAGCWCYSSDVTEEGRAGSRPRTRRLRRGRRYQGDLFESWSPLLEEPLEPANSRTFITPTVSGHPPQVVSYKSPISEFGHESFLGLAASPPLQAKAACHSRKRSVVTLDLCGSRCLPFPRANEGRGAPAAAQVDAPTPSHGFDLGQGDPVLLGEWVDGPQFADPPIGSWCSIHTMALDFRAERPRPLEPDPRGYPITRNRETCGHPRR